MNTPTPIVARMVTERLGQLPEYIIMAVENHIRNQSPDGCLSAYTLYETHEMIDYAIAELRQHS